MIDDRFYLVGRQDASEEKDFGGGRAAISDLTKNLDKDKYTIVLDHQPSDYEAEAAAGVDLVLSGHTHGGQLILSWGSSCAGSISEERIMSMALSSEETRILS